MRGLVDGRCAAQQELRNAVLDAHISGPRIARALCEAGHDVRAADEERELDGLPDEQLLSIAAVARRWAEAARTHAAAQ